MTNDAKEDTRNYQGRDQSALLLPPSEFRFLGVQEGATAPARAFLPDDLSADQLDAYNRVLRWYEKVGTGVLSLGGYAGTGKTTLVSTIAQELCIERGKAVAFLTPTAKAASVLRRKLAPLGLSIDKTYIGTVHSFMYAPMLDAKQELVGWSRRYFEKIEGEDGQVTYRCKNADDIPQVDLIIVDESSMVNEDMEDDIKAFGLPVLAVGDHGQLPPVQGRSSWMTEPNIRLERIHRQAENNPILALATYVRETGLLPKDVESFGIPYYRKLQAMAEPLKVAYGLRGEHEVAMVCFTNRLRAELNIEVHRELYKSDVPTNGSQVICLKNSKQLINGMRGFIRSDVKKKHIWSIARVQFPDEGFEYRGPFLTSQFGEAKIPKNIDVASELVGMKLTKMDQLGALFDFGYALTCHKAQGSQFQEVFVVLESGRRPQDYARWLYTAITRASEQLSFCETWG